MPRPVTGTRMWAAPAHPGCPGPRPSLWWWPLGRFRDAGLRADARNGIMAARAVRPGDPGRGCSLVVAGPGFEPGKASPPLAPGPVPHRPSVAALLARDLPQPGVNRQEPPHVPQHPQIVSEPAARGGAAGSPTLTREEFPAAWQADHAREPAKAHRPPHAGEAVAPRAPVFGRDGAAGLRGCDHCYRCLPGRHIRPVTAARAAADTRPTGSQAPPRSTRPGAWRSRLEASRLRAAHPGAALGAQLASPSPARPGLPGPVRSA